jgi:hypothetical protein
VVTIEDAMKHYSSEIEEGQKRILPKFHESAHDLLQMNLGELMDGEQARVTITMIKLLEIEDEFYMFRLPTSYFTRFDKVPYSKKGVETLKLQLRRPTFTYQFTV